MPDRTFGGWILTVEPKLVGMLMDIIHFADVHLERKGPFEDGFHLHGRTLDYLESFDILIDFAIEEDVDLALFAGDAFDGHNPTQHLLTLFSRRVVRLARQCPLVMVPGNHDMPGPVYKSSSLDVFDSDIPNVIVANKYKVIVVETKSGPVQVGAFPYPMRQHILSASDLRRSKKDTFPKYQALLVEKLEEMSEQLQPDMPSILLGHFTVSGSVYGSERPMILDKEAEIPLMEVIEDYSWDYVALGHIHKRQKVWDDPPVMYCGSLDRIDFSEEEEEKGFILIHIDEEDFQVECEWIDVDARPMVTIEVDAIRVDNVSGHIKETIEEHDVKDAIVRLIIKCDDTVYVNNEEIIRQLEEKGMYYLQEMSTKIPPQFRARLELEKDIAAYSPTEILDVYFQDKGLDGNEKEDLLELAVEIMEDTDV